MIKSINDDLYKLICTWWEAHSWPALPQELLPKRGYVIYINEKPVIAGFVYKDETSGFGMLEWIVSNPESTKEERDEGFRELVAHVESVGREIGIKFLFTYANHVSLIQKYQSNGFMVVDQNNTHLIKEI